MGILRRNDPRSGFALLGMLLILVVIVAAGAIGVYVWQHRTNTTTQNNTTASTTGTAPTAAAGTTAHVLQLTQSDAQDESKIDSGADAQAQQDAQSANTAQSNVGGAYNETTF